MNPFTQARLLTLKIDGFPKAEFTVQIAESEKTWVTVTHGPYSLSFHCRGFAEAARGIPAIASTLLHMHINDELIKWPI